MELSKREPVFCIGGAAGGGHGAALRGVDPGTAVAFFRKEDCIDEPMIQAEVDRYIDTPAQALSYKLGQLRAAGALTTRTWDEV